MSTKAAISKLLLIDGLNESNAAWSIRCNYREDINKINIPKINFVCIALVMHRTDRCIQCVAAVSTQFRPYWGRMRPE